MVQPYFLGSACVLIVAGCTSTAIIDGPSAGGAGGEDTSTAVKTASTGVTSVTSATTAKAASSTDASSSTGAECIPLDCADQNPCTIDACTPGGCSNEARPAGTPGDLAEGTCEGVCQTDGQCGLQMYKRFLDEQTWTKTALSLEWNGPNSPPPRGIVAAARGLSLDYIVFRDDGMVHRRFDGTWSPPVPGADLFKMDTTTIHAIVYLTSNLHFVWGLKSGAETQFVFQINGTAVLDLNSYPAYEGDGIPRGSQPVQWALQLPDLHNYLRLANGNVYHYGNEGPIDVLPEVMSPIWGDPMTAPKSGTVVEAMWITVDDRTQLQFIAP